MPECSYAIVVGVVYMMPSVHAVLASTRLAMHKENKQVGKRNWLVQTSILYFCD